MVEAKKAAPNLVPVNVELFGSARIVSGRRSTRISVPKHAGPGDVAAALAEACPELVGSVILRDHSGLQPSYVFNLNGILFLTRRRLRMKPGDTILLFSSQVGG